MSLDTTSAISGAITDSAGILEWVLAPARLEEFLVFILIGFVGIFCHYMRKVLSDEIKGTFYDYMVGDHKANTITAVTTFLSTAITYVFSGSVTNLSWQTLIGLAFTTGYTLDSIFNKGAKPDAPALATASPTTSEPST